MRNPLNMQHRYSGTDDKRSVLRYRFRPLPEEWKGNHIYLTELVLVLNHKIWQWYTEDPRLGDVYNELWGKADEYACTHLQGEELSYFYETTD